MDSNQHLKRDVYCDNCGWTGLSGDLIAKLVLVCPKCSSEKIKYLVAEAPARSQ